MQPMTTEQALKLIDGVCANFKGTRQDHLRLQEAVGIVTKVTSEYNVILKEKAERQAAKEAKKAPSDKK